MINISNNELKFMETDLRRRYESKLSVMDAKILEVKRLEDEVNKIANEHAEVCSMLEKRGLGKYIKN